MISAWISDRGDRFLCLNEDDRKEGMGGAL